jgi:hypothetical protein
LIKINTSIPASEIYARLGTTESQKLLDHYYGAEEFTRYGDEKETASQTEEEPIEGEEVKDPYERMTQAEFEAERLKAGAKPF